ncbi:MAG: 3-hydroxyacyl-ACP dehydratase FabZ [Syntrophomonadaceae bacterium]|nr:3-hydroxyacyl-ACP dehydratase FabZ [Syntrophomonadaceae bacterium]
MLNSREIQDIIPHRYPLLLVDRIIEMEPGRRAVGIKNVSAGESFFQGHFPDNPIMPGVLILEALAQVGACTILSLDEYRNRIAYFAGIDGVKFRRMVLPGDQLRLEVELLRMTGRFGKASGRALVDGDLVAEGEFMFALEKTAGE